MHTSRPEGIAPKADEHNPITSRTQLEPLAAIKQLKQIPIIFEHGTNISETEIKTEKKILEEFLEKE